MTNTKENDVTLRGSLTIDTLGRITIPVALRKYLELEDGKNIRYYIKDKKIVLVNDKERNENETAVDRVLLMLEESKNVNRDEYIAVCNAISKVLDSE